MLFNSIEFAIFLPVVFLIYWAIGYARISDSIKLRMQNAFVVLVSYVFYGWWDEAFVRFYGIEKILTVSDKKFPAINDKLMCAVHVRRGDLAKLNIPGHYIVTPTQYFFDTINYVIDKYQKVRFCFFSDELDFIETDILPYIHLPEDCDYVLMHGNKAYEDLVLVAKCDMIIGSQGTASRHGARMNPRAGLILPKIENDAVIGYEIIKEPINYKREN